MKKIYHTQKMFDLKFIQEIRFFLFPENTTLYKLLTANHFKIRIAKQHL